MHDVRADVVEEALVVADDEQRLLPVLEVVVQPDDGVQVQVIGRLVQHEQGGLDEEGSGQADPHPPASGELVGGAVLHVAVEAKTAKQAAGLGLGLQSWIGIMFLI